MGRVSMDAFTEGMACFQGRDYPTAVPLFASVAPSSPNYARSRVGLGRALYLLGRHEEALAAFQQGIDHGEERRSLLLMGKAVVLGELGRNAEALSAFDEAVATGPP